jgi:hypothetical protein
MKLLEIVKSKNKNKRYTAIFLVNGKYKKISFGSSNHLNYLMHKDKERRRLYRARHQHDNINNPLSAGALAWYILWGNSTSLNENIKSFKNKFNL